MISNKVTISGVIESRFMLDHEFYNERFYQFLISVKRTSGIDDTIPVIVSERLIDVNKNMIGSYVSILGEFRSFNYNDGIKTRLLLYIFPQEISLVDETENVNEIVLVGTICKDPTYRKTPKGRTIADILLATNRINNKSDYIPCIAWGRNAFYISSLGIGSRIKLTGRIQSREYNKDGNVRTAYEVSVNMIERSI